MQTSWYQIKIKFQQVAEGDKVINVTEAYLFDAVSYTDAETRGYQYLANGRQDFQLFSITKMKLVEVFMQDDGSEHWFKCRVQYIIFDEKTKSEKKTAVMMLINAKDIKHAFESLKERIGSVDDYIISDINVTKILEVIPYELTPEQILSQGNFKPMAEVMAEPSDAALAEVEQNLEEDSNE
jgi:hypothetical protein